MTNIVHLGDCMEGMKQYPDKHFELCICDPPYGIDVAKDGKVGSSNNAKATNYGAKDWDKQPPSVEYFKELKRVSKNQIIWGANHFISRIPVDSSCWIVWDKNNSGNFADCELAWTSFYTAVKKFTYTWNGMLQQDMKNKEVRLHPTQKPVALYKWLLTNYAKPGDKIFDSHVGSGSSRIAADMLGFDFEGYEIDSDYWQAQEKRYNQYKSQLKLFV
jgi:site-specific DNA-methyltransferase (adenine-specific)